MAIRLQKRLTLSSMHDVDLGQPVDDGDQIEWDDDLGKWVNVPGHQLAEANPTGLVDGGEINIALPPSTTSFGPVAYADETYTLEWQCIRDDAGGGQPDPDWIPVIGTISSARVVTDGNASTLYIDAGNPQDVGQISCLATSPPGDVVVTERSNVHRLEVDGSGVDGIEVVAGIGVIVDSYTTPDTRPAVAAVSWNDQFAQITAAPSAAGSLVYLTIANIGGQGPAENTAMGELRQYSYAPTQALSLIHISEPTRRRDSSRMPSSA